MLTRRQVLSSVGVASVAGCLVQGSSDSTDCETNADRVEMQRIVADEEPSRSTVLSERVDTEVAYQPPDVVLVNTGGRRDFAVTVTREDASEALFDEIIGLADRAYARFILMAPDIWTVEATLPEGRTVGRSVRRFDCNERTFYLWIRCDGDSYKTSESNAFACPAVPVESE